AAHRPGAVPQPFLLVRLLPAVPEPESDPAQPIAFADPGPELLVWPALRRHRRRRPGRAQTAVPGAHTLAVAGFHAVRIGPGWSSRPGRARCCAGQLR